MPLTVFTAVLRRQTQYLPHFLTISSEQEGFCDKRSGPDMGVHSALFVTWNIKSGRDYRLRGCLGNFEPMPLHEGLAEYALISAFRDHRFRKIEKNELERLECAWVPFLLFLSKAFWQQKRLDYIQLNSNEPHFIPLPRYSISLLTGFEQAESYLDWTIGVHGIYITFPHPSLLPPSSETPSPTSSSGHLPRLTTKHTFSATYLPDVIPEQGWDKIEAIDSAIQKAGWKGRITEDLRRSIKLQRYESKMCSATWDEYIHWRKEQEGKR